jgi:hypothetical protein
VFKAVRNRQPSQPITPSSATYSRSLNFGFIAPALYDEAPIGSEILTTPGWPAVPARFNLP